MIGFKLIDCLWIVVFGAERPSDAAWAEWKDYRRAVEQQIGWSAARIIFHEPGWACSEQPAFLHELKGARVPIAVISNDPDIRGVVTVMSWFNRRGCGFAPTGLVDALDFLGVSADRAAQIEPWAEHLRQLVRRLRDVARWRGVRRPRLTRSPLLAESTIEGGAIEGTCRTRSRRSWLWGPTERSGRASPLP